MNSTPISRRHALQILPASVAAAAFAQRLDAQPQQPGLIDAHWHIVSSRLPGTPTADADGTLKLGPFAKDDTLGPQRVAQAIQAEFKQAGIEQALCMPRLELSDADPLGINEALKQAKSTPGVKLHPIGLAHPERFDRDHLARVEEVLKQGVVKGFKAYLGYLHYDALHIGYRPYYKLAAKYNIPMIFHTGDTYSKTAKVRHAHPLVIDDLAVDFPETKFVIAHFGNPWIMDAAEVAYKNKNVWVDLSGLLIGDRDYFQKLEREGVLERTVKRIREGIEFTEAGEKFLFGSDWPLAPVDVYRAFVARLFPAEWHAAVFSGNAKALFGLS